uniref:Uncharacterized protein n=1 Tax=Sphaerodactylus townsendi TaxID=933632 RepID=A0ACB8ETW2_9SAUR
MLSRNGICAAFKERAPRQLISDDIDFLMEYLVHSKTNFLDSKANAVVVYDPINPTYSDEPCTGEEKLETVPAPFFEMGMTGHSYSIYNAVYAIAHALYILASSRTHHRAMENGGRLTPLNIPPWKLHALLQRMAFNNSAGEEVTFNEHGQLNGGFRIFTNLVKLFQISPMSRVNIGRLDPSGSALLKDFYSLLRG